MDESNDVYYVRARYYDSGAGRFLSRDPVSAIGPRGINPYQYAWGNPMRFADPSGRDPVSEDELYLRYLIAATNKAVDAARHVKEITNETEHALRKVYVAMRGADRAW